MVIEVLKKEKKIWLLKCVPYFHITFLDNINPFYLFNLFPGINPFLFATIIILFKGATKYYKTN